MRLNQSVSSILLFLLIFWKLELEPLVLVQILFTNFYFKSQSAGQLCFSLKNHLFLYILIFDCFHFHIFLLNPGILTQPNLFTDSGTAISCLDKKCKRISFSFPVKLQWFRRYQIFLDNILQSQIISDKGRQSL